MTRETWSPVQWPFFLLVFRGKRGSDMLPPLGSTTGDTKSRNLYSPLLLIGSLTAVARLPPSSEYNPRNISQ